MLTKLTRAIRLVPIVDIKGIFINYKTNDAYFVDGDHAIAIAITLCQSLSIPSFYLC